MVVECATIFMNMKFELKITFEPYSELFLEKSWTWLNDPTIKRLTCTPNFTKEEQSKWFLSLPNKKDYFIKGIMYNNIPIGACGLKHISSSEAEYWGYIGLKEYWGKGFGSVIMTYIEQIAKNELKIFSLYLFVNKDNERAIKLYKKRNYVIESSDNTMYKMRKQL